MKKIIFMTFVVALILVSCGANKKTEEKDNKELGVEEVQENKDIVDKHYELCKVETITEDKVILYSLSSECYYEVELSEENDFCEGEYYGAEFTNKTLIGENKYSIEDAIFHHEVFQVEIINR